MAGRASRAHTGPKLLGLRISTCVLLALGVAITTVSPAAAAAPSAPVITYVAAGPGVASMTVRWSAAKSNGGPAVTGYEYRVQTDSGPFGPPSPLAETIRSAALPCLAPAAAGHGCTFEVRATNGTPGGWSVPVGASWTGPSAPLLGRSLAGPSAGVATLSWRAPKTTGGLPVAYEYEVNAGSGWSGPTGIDAGSITSPPGQRWPVLSAVVGCSISVAAHGCSYILFAVNAVGTSTASKSRTAVLRRPDPPTDLQVVTTSVALGTGVASQAISWTSPANVGGLALTDNVVSECSTASGSVCVNPSPGWVQIADLAGDPPATSTVAQCPGNGWCAYEVWAKNPVGKGWLIGDAHPGVPTNLSATSSGAPGNVQLQWLNVVDVGAAFGNYVLFECDSTQACGNGAWTNVPADAGPWTRIDLSGTATTTLYQCASAPTCTFRVGYVDTAGNIGGVTNAVTVQGA